MLMKKVQSEHINDSGGGQEHSSRKLATEGRCCTSPARRERKSPKKTLRERYRASRKTRSEQTYWCHSVGAVRSFRKTVA